MLFGQGGLSVNHYWQTSLDWSHFNDSEVLNHSFNISIWKKTLMWVRRQRFCAEYLQIWSNSPFVEHFFAFQTKNIFKPFKNEELINVVLENYSLQQNFLFSVDVNRFHISRVKSKYGLRYRNDTLGLLTFREATLSCISLPTIITSLPDQVLWYVELLHNMLRCVHSPCDWQL